MNLLIAPPPLPYPPRYIIDPVAFFAALIGGPLLFTGMTFAVFFIPVIALVVGGPAYLVVGTPLLLWYLRYNDGDPTDLGWLAAKVMMLGILASGILAAITRAEDAAVLVLYAVCGMIFAPAWAYFFGLVYQYFRRDFFAKPRSF